MPRVGRNREKHTRLPVGWALGPRSKRTGVRTIYFRPTNLGDRAIVKAITGGPLSLRLGATFDEAHTAFDRLIVAARRKETAFAPGFVTELVDRARRDYLPTIKNEETRAWRARHIDELERTFGARRYARNVYDATKAAPGTYLVAMDAQRHIDQNQHRHVAVNRAVQTWKIVWDEARRRWGLTEYNPCAGLEPNDEHARETLPDDRAHFFKVYRALDPPARFVLALGRYYGRRRGEALRIELSGLQDDGVHTIRGKRKRELILSWDDAELELDDGRTIVRPGRLRKMVARALRWRDQVIRPQKVWKNGRKPAAPRVVATTLLINRRGGKITPSGFMSAFRRGMERVGLVEILGTEEVNGKVRTRTRRAFNPNDTRAKRASTLKKLQDAQEVLAHDEQRTTAAIYRRGPIVIDLKDRALVDLRKRPGNSRKVGNDRS